MLAVTLIPLSREHPTLERHTQASGWASIRLNPCLFPSYCTGYFLFPLLTLVRSMPEGCLVWGVGWGNGSPAIQILEQPPQSVCEGSTEPRTLCSMVACDALKPRLEWIIWPFWISPSSASQTRLRVLALPASQEEAITLGECLWFQAH